MVQSRPDWLKVKMPGGDRYTRIKARARELRLHTVCEEARCPNVGECWGGGTATFMVLGDTCTRGCRFCAVMTARNPAPPDAAEPANLADAIAEMELDFVVVTSVNRDDLPDQGAGHFAACITASRERSPQTLVEVLIPDLRGDTALLDVILAARPDVLAHNVETIPRLQAPVRDPRASWAQSLAILAHAKSRGALTKTSIQIGHGESEAEVIAAMTQLRTIDVDFLTLGQYLRPTPAHLAVTEFVTPEVFARYEAAGLAMGFRYVASGPLVRSSYKAGEYFMLETIRARAAAPQGKA
ncbi:MAG: lipoyl synthase [Myxococcales bacterium]|nr:lipoyl synthase [Myxococcales bacterium]